MQVTSALFKLLCLASVASVIASPTPPPPPPPPQCVVVQWVIHKLHIRSATPFCSIYLQIPTVTETFPVTLAVPTHTVSTYELKPKPEKITAFPTPPALATIRREALSKACECLSIPTPTITITATFPFIPSATSSVAASTTTSSSTTPTPITSTFTNSTSTTSTSTTSTTPVSTNGTSTSTTLNSTSTTGPQTSSPPTTWPSTVPPPFLSSVLSATTPNSTVVPTPFFPANSTFFTYSHHTPTFTPSTSLESPGYP
ncbi:hypothetical protein F5B19DRAFT_439516 [Rostrohypoxylon terebratum]|nr:hypothetical protein F5B19DRAFT_439516 [Rostrohypoxylon terebratum]